LGRLKPRIRDLSAVAGGIFIRRDVGRMADFLEQ
jgi:hypothetical protein